MTGLARDSVVRARAGNDRHRCEISVSELCMLPSLGDSQFIVTRITVQTSACMRISFLYNEVTGSPCIYCSHLFRRILQIGDPARIYLPRVERIPTHKRGLPYLALSLKTGVSAYRVIEQYPLLLR